MRKLYPSSAAFMVGGLVFTEYNSGCLRSIVLEANGCRTDIPKIYQEVGAAHENWIEEHVLKPDKRLVVYAREVPIKQPIPGVEGVEYSGRMDVLACYLEVGQVILETKGTISKNTRLSVIRKGHVKLSHLAQLVSYMIAKEVTRGKIIAGYYERDGEGGPLVLQESREFKVRIEDDGAISVDGQPTMWTVHDQLAHRVAAAQALVTEAVPPPPADAEKSWGGPCTRCMFKSVCAKIASKESDYVGFLEAGREATRAYNAQPAPEPVAHLVKRKAPKSERPNRPRGGSGNSRKPKASLKE